MVNHRYDAARAAARAGCGQGKDCDKLDGPERARLRLQALDWLRADLKSLRSDQHSRMLALPVPNVMRHWLAAADFAGVRRPEALAKLPPSERAGWQKLWDEVAGLANRPAAPKAAPADAAALDTVYKALKLTSLTVDAGPLRTGDTVRIDYDLKNTLERDLPVPIHNTFKCPVAGLTQHWIERLGADSRLPFAPEWQRSGTRYRLGGAIVCAPNEMPPGHSILLAHATITTAFPPGRYRYHVDFSDRKGNILHSASVDFELLP